MSQPPEPPPGRGRELSRTRKSRSAPVDTGRRHHLGAAPELMPVWLPDGTIIATRTSAAQLADRNQLQLRRLLTRLRDEMTAAAAELDFEQAAQLRDEVASVEAELARRSNPA